MALPNLAYFGVGLAVAPSIRSVSLFADRIDFLEDASIDVLIRVALGWSARHRARVGMALGVVLLAPGLATLWAGWQRYSGRECGTLERRTPMNIRRIGPLFVGPAITAMVLVSAASAQVPDTIAATGETVVATMHAEGAQVYECKADAGGRLGWQFREPIATLFVDGKTVGRHYTGPSWEHSDGSAVVGKVLGRAPGATPKDIPWLKLEITERRGAGVLSGVTTVQRISTQGGAAEGGCDKAGAYLSVAYAADYVFYRK